MCGIALHFNSLGWARALDLERIRHRGPDSRGEWTSPGGHCWLGNTRLAIVDLSPTGAQPMMDPVTGNVIVTNGEIYNHRAVREKLGPNVEWRGTSDTETLLVGYARWGRAVVDRVKGMFAFAIYDAARKELFLARDRLGQKPLYYVVERDGVCAASEGRMLVNGSGKNTPPGGAPFLSRGARAPPERTCSPHKSPPPG